MRASRWIVHSRRKPSAILLSVQLLGMLVYPFIEGAEAGRIAFGPGLFAAAVNPEQLRTWTELMYLSFALLSSNGIGDVIPLSPITRAVAAFEMFVGVMYLAAVVSRLIGLTLIQHGPPGAK